MIVQPSHIIGTDSIQPTSVTITFPTDDSVVAFSPTPTIITWTVDQGSNLGSVYIDSVLITSNRAGSYSTAFSPGDHTVQIKVAGGTVSSSIITVHARATISSVIDNGDGTLLVTFDSGITVNSGFTPGDTGFSIMGSGVLTASQASVISVTITVAAVPPYSGQSWDSTPPVGWINEEVSTGSGFVV